MHTHTTHALGKRSKQWTQPASTHITQAPSFPITQAMEYSMQAHKHK